MKAGMAGDFVKNGDRPFVSVVIPVLNDARRLRSCLEALEGQSYPGDRYEVIVVDNGSHDNMEPAQLRWSRIVFSREGKRGSYAARNKGLSLARGEVVAFTDSDCIPAGDWIERGVSRLSGPPECGMAGGKVEFFFKNKNQPAIIELYDSMTYLNQERHLRFGRFAATANLFVFKKIFDKAGPFDETLKSGGDVVWGRRVYSLGFRQVYAEDARVAHPARTSFGELYKTTARIVGGRYDCERKEASRFRCFSRGLKGDYQSSRTLIRDLKREGWKRRSGLLFLDLSLKFISSAERIRLCLGGASRY